MKALAALVIQIGLINFFNRISATTPTVGGRMEGLSEPARRGDRDNAG